MINRVFCIKIQLEIGTKKSEKRKPWKRGKTGRLFFVPHLFARRLRGANVIQSVIGSSPGHSRCPAGQYVPAPKSNVYR